MSRLAIYGTGGSGKQLYETIVGSPSLSSIWDSIVFIDDTREAALFRGEPAMPFADFCKEFSPADTKAVIAVGEPSDRSLLAHRVKEAGFSLATIQHEQAKISPTAHIGEGCVLMPNCSVSVDATLGDNTWLQSYALIGHDAEIGENCQISNFVVVAGHTKVGNNCYLGTSSCLRENIVVGDDSVISMGAIVLKSTHSGMVVMGNPAREIAKNTGVFK